MDFEVMLVKMARYSIFKARRDDAEFALQG